MPPAGPLPRQARPIADVVVPVPREIFGTLDQFTNFNWRAVQLPALARSRPHGGQTQIALLLGVVIAEGFIAVEAEDAVAVKELGGAALGLARALGVSQAVLRRGSSIVECAERNDWKAVRHEWDGMLPDVQQGMKELRSEPLAQLVSLGGWLRGTQALSALVEQRYSPERAELLRQPALLDYFEGRLKAMGGKPQVATMREGIGKMRVLLAGSPQPVSEASVKRLAVVCDELLGTVVARTANP